MYQVLEQVLYSVVSSPGLHPVGLLYPPSYREAPCSVWRLKELKGGEGGRSGVSVKVGGVKMGGVEGGEGGRSGGG